MKLHLCIPPTARCVTTFCSFLWNCLCCSSALKTTHTHKHTGACVRCGVVREQQLLQVLSAGVLLPLQEGEDALLFTHHSHAHVRPHMNAQHTPEREPCKVASSGGVNNCHVLRPKGAFRSSGYFSSPDLFSQQGEEPQGGGAIKTKPLAVIGGELCRN